MDSFEAPGGSSPGALSVLVLGGYGLIGSAIMRCLTEAGHAVTGAGRSERAARRSGFDTWRFFDAGQVQVPEWRDAIRGFDVVVNASGALQDGARDNLTAIHETALARLGAAAAESGTLVVQVSAAGVAEDASTEFFRSKARGERTLQASGAACVILRPTLVLAPTAYGGTALLRAGAALPCVLPKLLPDAEIQCVHVDDLANAVRAAAEGRIAAGTDVEVSGADALSFPALLKRTRRWLGFPDAVWELPLPRWALVALSKGADLTGWFGWRAPLRSTAVTVLAEGVRGDAAALQTVGGPVCRDMEGIFCSLPSTLQDRWFARVFLLLPIAILTLSLFWIASGGVGLFQSADASVVLTSRGFETGPAMFAVISGSVIDIALGTAVLFKRWAKPACLGMIAVALAYLGGATLFTPDLWLDPLGPLVKVVPTLTLTLFTLAVLDDR